MRSTFSELVPRRHEPRVQVVIEDVVEVLVDTIATKCQQLLMEIVR